MLRHQSRRRVDQRFEKEQPVSRRPPAGRSGASKSRDSTGILDRPASCIDCGGKAFAGSGAFRLAPHSCRTMHNGASGLLLALYLVRRLSVRSTWITLDFFTGRWASPRQEMTMHLFVILLFMLFLPIISIIQDVLFRNSDLMPTIGKWYVYWGVGWRLIIAGGHQLLRPSFTAKDIFEIDDPKASKLILEIGFGNLAIGIASVASLHFPDWIPGMALAGAIFFALAGIQHVRNRASTRPEITAMVSDLGAAVILIAYLFWLAT